MLGTLLVLYMNFYRVLIEPLWGVKLFEKKSLRKPKTIYPNEIHKFEFYIPMHRLLASEKKNVDTLAQIRSSIAVWLHTNYMDL